ncbi:MAG TPA: hypothetical protein VHQ00_08655, partial [Chloroflexota bacterium]|nr:hypothetical protein [Chloroflexota bacterium]
MFGEERRDGCDHNATAPGAARRTLEGTPGWVRRVYRFPRPLTPAEFMELSPRDHGMGEGRLQLVGGDVVEMPPEFGDHTDVAHDLRAALEVHARSRGGDAF